MKLNLKPFAVAAAVLAGTAARAGSTYDPFTDELHDGGPSTIVSHASTYDPFTDELRDSRPSTEALAYGALVESTGVTSEQFAGSGGGEAEAGTTQAQEQQGAGFGQNIWTMGQ